MIEWLAANKEWIFSGVGATIIAGIAAAFRFLRPKKDEAPPATVVFRVENPPILVSHRTPATPAAPVPVEPSKPATPVPVERISSITPNDIHKAIANALPLQRDSVADRFKGLKIEWDTSLRAGREREDGKVRLYLRAREAAPDWFGDWFDVDCEVLLSDYRELGILPQGSLIRLYGEIQRATAYSVELTNVRLLYMEPAKEPAKVPPQEESEKKSAKDT